jgi:hypothetical protein
MEASSMTTLEEISVCPLANREFWTERARFNLINARELRGADLALALAAFRRNMKNRREQTYLDKRVGQLDMFGEAA